MNDNTYRPSPRAVAEFKRVCEDTGLLGELRADRPAPLTRRPCVIGGKAEPDDWQIMADGQSVGRIFRAFPGAPLWIWSMGTGSEPQLDTERGRAGSYEEARVLFQVAWEARQAK